MGLKIKLKLGGSSSGPSPAGHPAPPSPAVVALPPSARTPPPPPAQSNGSSGPRTIKLIKRPDGGSSTPTPTPIPKPKIVLIRRDDKGKGKAQPQAASAPTPAHSAAPSNTSSPAPTSTPRIVLKAKPSVVLKVPTEEKIMPPPPMPPPPLPAKLPAFARVKAEPTPSPLGSPAASTVSLPSSPVKEEDLLVLEASAEPKETVPEGPRVPAVGASAASGKKLVGGQLQRPFLDVLDKMLQELMRRDAYGFFLNPVSEEDVPGYSSIISEPMDLTTIRDKAHSGEYKNFDEFQYDARLVFANCLQFNEPSSIFGLMATKLGRWLEDHLVFYRELVIPGSEADQAPAWTREGSQTSQAGSPGRSRSVSMALSADDEGSSSAPVKVKRTGNGQLGKKRGPYRKTGQVAVANYFQAPASQASNQFVVTQTQGGYVDENGRIRGAGAHDYAPEFQQVVRWWEAGGKRAKTKKELSKIATRKARDEYGGSVMADGSRDLREEESLEEVLDAFYQQGVERPTIESLPQDFVANMLGRSVVSAAFTRTPLFTHQPPPPRPPLGEATYGESFNGETLPEAFSWRKPNPPRAGPPAQAVPPKVRSRLVAPSDWGMYPYFTSPSISPAGLFDNERRDFLAPPVPAPRCATAIPSVDADKAARQEAVKALSVNDELLRKVIYGGWVGESYADSMSTFIEGAFGGDRGAEAKKWIEEHVYGPMFGIESALPLAKAVVRVINEAGGLQALDKVSPEALAALAPDVDMDDLPDFKFDPPSPPVTAVKQEKEDEEMLVMEDEKREPQEDEDMIVIEPADSSESKDVAVDEPSLDIPINNLQWFLPADTEIRSALRRMREPASTAA